MLDDVRLTAAAREAAALALRLFEDGFDHWEKARGDPVTEADIAVDALLRERLCEPGDGWLSEESADTPERLSCARVWVVDPIDGTRDFLRGRPGWAVSAALVEDGRPVLAALAAPALGRLYLARAGGGATLNGRVLACAPPRPGEALRLPMDADAARRLPGVEAVYKPNAVALRVAMVATGEADAFLAAQPSNEWDLAAAVLIAAEARARVTDRRGAALAFNKAVPRVEGLAVAAMAAHGDVLARLQAAVAGGARTTR